MNTQVKWARQSWKYITSSTAHSFAEVASEELHYTIIWEWQEVILMDSFDMSMCSPCSRCTLSHSIVLVPISDVNLSLLRNDGLPPNVVPTPYNFIAYQRALLHPKGLIDHNALDNILMCKAHHWALVSRCWMPWLCLVNWLYYRHNELLAGT